MVAEQKARNNTRNLHRITACSLLLVIAAGTLVSLFIYFNLDMVSGRLLGDKRTYNALFIMVPCIPAVVAASGLKGYFYGIQQVMPTAFSQVAEQLVKIGFLILLAGEIMQRDVEYACAIATLSSALGEIANLAVLVIVYAVKRKYFSIIRAGSLMRKRKIITSLFKASLPISANRLVVSALMAVEIILIPTMLARGGLEYKSSMEIFGRLTGMALPLIMFPSLVTNSLATTLVPAISESMSLKNYKTVNFRISKSIQVTFILGVIFTALFINYPNQIGSLIYRREKIGDLLYMLAFTCIFIYLNQTLTGVLNGLGKQGLLLRNTVIGSVLRIAAVYFLVPVFGISSYIWGLTASYIITSVLNTAAINKITGLVINLREWILRPGLVGIVMVFAGRYIYHFFNIFKYSETLTVILTITTYVLAAFFLMVFAGVLKMKEVFNFSEVKLNGMKK
jgi:stage V sporulation protein B